MDTRYYELYSRSFEKFLSHTDEKQVFIDEFNDYLDQYQPASLLDIGAGNGTLAKALAARVDNYVAVEHNPGYAERLRQAGLTVIEGSFPAPISETFDLVLLSHAISYEKRNHSALLISAWERVNPAGHLLVVTHRGEKDDWSDLLDAVNMSKLEAYAPIYDEIINLLASYGKTEVRKVITTLDTDSLQNMVDAMAFVASAGNQESFETFMAARQKIEDLLNKKYRTETGFTFPFTHIFISTKKAEQ
jgi:SAM-dependent methyltransferase